MRAIDADAHVDETEQTWAYLAPDEERFRPITFDLPDGESVGPSDGRRHRLWLINGNARLRRFRNDELTGTTRETRELIDVEARVRHMDQLDIETQVLFPTTFLHAVTSRPEIELALFKTYNRWLADRTAATNGRLRWVALAPTLSIDAAVEELHFAKDNGACAFMLKGVETGNRAAGDPYLYPLYEAAERLGLAVCFHQGTGDPNSSNANTASAASMASMNVVAAFHALAAARVPDRFPGLRFGFIEAGASWIPYMLKELGMRGKAEKAGYDFRTDFFAHNRFYVTCDTEDDVAYLLNFGTEDHLILGTDYSHVDQSAELRAHQVLIERGDRGEFSTTAAAKIVSTNAKALYGL